MAGPQSQQQQQFRNHVHHQSLHASHAVDIRDVHVQVLHKHLPCDNDSNQGCMAIPLRASVQSCDEFYRTVFREVIRHPAVWDAYKRHAFNFQYVLRQPFALCTNPSGQQFQRIQDPRHAVENRQPIFWICESYARLENPAACVQLQPFYHVDMPESKDRQQRWPCVFHMKDLAKRFDFKNTAENGRVWNPGAGAYPVPDAHMNPDAAAIMAPPQLMHLECRWLCDPGYMDAAVKGQFYRFMHQSGMEQPRPPTQSGEQINMESGFDYLEWAFVHLFGQWNPTRQTFSRSYALTEDMESIYKNSGWIPRLLNRAFETLPHFNQGFHTVCPWSGMGVFWCAAFILWRYEQLNYNTRTLHVTNICLPWGHSSSHMLQHYAQNWMPQSH